MISCEPQALHEFRGEYKGKERWALVYRTLDNQYLVRFFINQVWREDRYISDHSEVYAEDTAENFVLGVIE